MVLIKGLFFRGIGRHTFFSPPPGSVTAVCIVSVCILVSKSFPKASGIQSKERGKSDSAEFITKAKTTGVSWARIIGSEEVPL